VSDGSDEVGMTIERRVWNQTLGRDVDVWSCDSPAQAAGLRAETSRL
jgi:hypothetical protein